MSCFFVSNLVEDSSYPSNLEAIVEADVGVLTYDFSYGLIDIIILEKSPMRLSKVWILSFSSKLVGIHPSSSLSLSHKCFHLKGDMKIGKLEPTHHNKLRLIRMSSVASKFRASPCFRGEYGDMMSFALHIQQFPFLKFSLAIV